jgi:Alw26I/Eco31I/Esp3I family type II restriction endonuclease
LGPIPRDLEGWLTWLDTVFIPAEPRGILSPGAMSNAPDRFDGFHCDNLCCRGTADKGRHKKNLQTYVTDRRVFEYWTSGDWVAADRLMGRLRSGFPDEVCRHGHPGPCAVDHIGPISLGFTHRAHFQLLCAACNSAKNNRMYRSDVELLKMDELGGDTVVSWHTKALWDACKTRVKSDEQARRLSKMMRDNRHSLMHALGAVAKSGAFTFLASLLELERADSDVEFVNLRIEDHLTVFDKMRHTPRTTTYANEQKARRCRVAFTELINYFQKSNRNSFVVSSPESDRLLHESITIRKADSAATAGLDNSILDAIKGEPGTADRAFRLLVPQLAPPQRVAFKAAQALLQRHMDAIADLLAARWEEERYVRNLEADLVE